MSRHPAERPAPMAAVPASETSHGVDGQAAAVAAVLAPLCERIAERVAALVVERLAVPPVPVHAPLLAWTCADVARELGRSMDWVREHRAELGVLPASGPRPRLMFDPSAVRAWATARDGRVRSVAADPAPALTSRAGGARRLSSGRPAVHADGDLLPIRGDRRAA